MCSVGYYNPDMATEEAADGLSSLLEPGKSTEETLAAYNKWADKYDEVSTLKWRHTSFHHIAGDSTVCSRDCLENIKDPPLTEGFPSQRVRNAESVAMPWHLVTKTKHKVLAN